MCADDRPIGIFDSGLGGITSLRKMIEILPNEDIIYLGDTGRVPYGTRSRETIEKYALQDIAFLSTFDIKAVLVACGTVSTSAMGVVESAYDIPIFGVVKAAARKAVSVTKNNKVGIIGTAASINSGAFEKEIKKLGGDIETYSKACPLFVPLVEDGRINVGDIVIETVAREYLSELRDAGIDTLLMGCTHYPLLSDIISAIMGPDVALISSGEEATIEVFDALFDAGLLTSRSSPGKISYYVTDSVNNNFASLASLFMQRDINGEVKKVDLDKY